MRALMVAAASMVAIASAVPASARAQAAGETPLLPVRADPGDARVLVTLPAPDASPQPLGCMAPCLGRRETGPR